MVRHASAFSVVSDPQVAEVRRNPAGLGVVLLKRMQRLAALVITDEVEGREGYGAILVVCQWGSCDGDK